MTSLTKEFQELNERLESEVNSVSDLLGPLYEACYDAVQEALFDLTPAQKFAVVSGVIVRAVGNGNAVVNVLAVSTLETALVDCHKRIVQQSPLIDAATLRLASAQRIVEAE